MKNTEEPVHPRSESPSVDSQVSDISLNGPFRAKSSATNTFLALNHAGPRIQTLEAFRHLPKPTQTRERALKIRLNFVALELIALWTSDSPENSNQYTIHYKYDRHTDKIAINTSYYFPESTSYKHFSHAQIKQEFLKQNGVSLGSLCFLNAILEGGFSDRNLGICYDINFGMGHFIQRSGGNFFKGFTGQEVQKSISVEHDFLDYIRSSSHTAWWQKVLGDLGNTEEIIQLLRAAFLKEYFVTALKVYLTPDKFIKLIVKDIMGESFDFSDVSAYIIRVKESVIHFLTNFLTVPELYLWHRFQEQSGNQVVGVLLNDTDNYVSKLERQNLSLERVKISIDTLVNASQFGIRDLLDFPFIYQIRYKRALDKAEILTYILSIAEENWALVYNDHLSEIWSIIDWVCKDLDSQMRESGYMLEQPADGIEFHVALFIVACRYNAINICRFLLSQFTFLATARIEASEFILPPFDEYLNLTMRECAARCENEEVVKLIDVFLEANAKPAKSQSARLNLAERKQRLEGSQVRPTFGIEKKQTEAPRNRRRRERSRSITEEDLTFLPSLSLPVNRTGGETFAEPGNTLRSSSSGIFSEGTFFPALVEDRRVDDSKSEDKKESSSYTSPYGNKL